MITARGRLVFVSESFDLDQARKLASLILDAQGTGDLRTARSIAPAKRGTQATGSTLSGGLVHLFAESGVMKVAVDAGMSARRPLR